MKFFKLPKVRELFSLCPITNISGVIMFLPHKLKISIAALFLSTSISAFAGLADLMYLNGKGKFRYNGRLLKTSDDYKSKTSKTNFEGEYEESGFYMANEFTYGVMDKLTVGLELNYLFGNDAKTKSFKSNGAALKAGTDFSDNDVESSGLFDPAVRGTYRVKEFGAMALDGKVVLSPGFGDNEEGQAEVGKNPSKGNALRGGGQAQIGAAFGTSKGKLQWMGQLMAIYNFSQDKKEKGVDGAADVKSEVDSHLNFSLTGAVQYGIIDKLTAGAGLQVIRYGEFDTTPAKTPNAYSTTESHMGFTLSAKVDYQISSNILVGFEFNRSAKGDYELKTNGSTDIATIKDYVNLEYGLKFSYAM